MEPDVEHHLILQAQRGDVDARERLYRAHSSALYHRVIRPRVRSDADAEDALAKTFMAAFRKLDAFEAGPKGMFPWLARIAMNTCYDLGRQAARDQRRREALARIDLTPPPRPDDLSVRYADRKESARRVDDVLGTINVRYARALRLRLLDERTRAECAEVLETTVATFDVVLLRAVRAFRTAYIERFGAGEGGLI
ncbi:MAG: RNA polymerase sigma factor (sigma-70 family) [Myxococcota bacterium]